MNDSKVYFVCKVFPCILFCLHIRVLKTWGSWDPGSRGRFWKVRKVKVISTRFVAHLKSTDLKKVRKSNVLTLVRNIRIFTKVRKIKILTWMRKITVITLVRKITTLTQSFKIVRNLTYLSLTRNLPSLKLSVNIIVRKIKWEILRASDREDRWQIL